MPVYRELDSKTASYITDLNVIFSSFFGRQGADAEIEKMKSFVGLVDLIKRNLELIDQQLIVLGFADILWGKGAQGLVRDDPQADYATKVVAFDFLTKSLGTGNLDAFKVQIKTYYQEYK